MSKNCEGIFIPDPSCFFFCPPNCPKDWQQILTFRKHHAYAWRISSLMAALPPFLTANCWELNRTLPLSTSSYCAASATHHLHDVVELSPTLLCTFLPAPTTSAAAQICPLAHIGWHLLDLLIPSSTYTDFLVFFFFFCSFRWDLETCFFKHLKVLYSQAEWQFNLFVPGFYTWWCGCIYSVRVTGMFGKKQTKKPPRKMLHMNEAIRRYSLLLCKLVMLLFFYLLNIPFSFGTVC